MKYDASLVQSMFLHALLTWIRSDMVKSEIRPFLEDKTTSDELPLSKL